MVRPMNDPRRLAFACVARWWDLVLQVYPIRVAYVLGIMGMATSSGPEPNLIDHEMMGDHHEMWTGPASTGSEKRIDHFPSYGEEAALEEGCIRGRLGSGRVGEKKRLKESDLVGHTNLSNKDNRLKGQTLTSYGCCASMPKHLGRTGGFIAVTSSVIAVWTYGQR
jgi:hypothetical protein